MKYNRSFIVLGAGVLFLLAIHFIFIHEEVFYSEDGGIKMLMIKQYQTGNYSNTLVVRDAPNWATQLWDQGLYYFRNPFVYDTPKGKMAVFPSFFPMINAPLYNLFGFHGLYIIPILSLVLLWFLFVDLCRKLHVDDKVTFLSLLALVFASSLTFYASVFWEHTLATFCVFVGLYYYALSNLPDRSVISAFALGLLFGASSCFRPESLFMIAIIGSAIGLKFLSTKRSSHVVFLIGTALSVMVFFAYNKFAYGSFTGLHSRQITEKFDLIDRVKSIGYIFAVQTAKTILYDPMTIFIFAAVLLLRKDIIRTYKAGNSLPLFLIVALVLFFITSPLILPNTGGRNWGIRYALVSLPVLYVCVPFLLGIAQASRHRKILMIMFFVMLVYGGVLNTFKGSETLYANYNGAKTEVIDYLQEKPPSILLITKSYQAAEFEVLMSNSMFFQVDTEESLRIFLNSPEALKHSVTVLYDYGDNQFRELMLKPEHLSNFKKVKSFGSYDLYELDKSTFH